ncbi:MAG TPA: flagellar basal body L-ring protein FlgH [Pyrinomonadaceae bacterium]|jgi:flagellar L-ring protein precursor FlgH|nr:flagellar basal body L-ring protein FlgH [Pyrinomonadaceae bacterium]
MKNKVLVILSLILLITSGALSIAAQDKKPKKKKNKQPALAVVTIEDAPIVEAPPAQKPANGSLFTPDAVGGSLLADFKAGRVGDLVFVDVVETSTATVSSGADRKRDSGTVGGLATVAGSLPISGAAAIASGITALGQRKFEGSGQTERKSNVKARITARVVEVLPNGDLRIQALKLVRVNKETEQMAVTGIVRKTDLAADNSIPTVAIGDLRVDFNGKGVASADNAPGWLFRLFDKISPF